MQPSPKAQADFLLRERILNGDAQAAETLFEEHLEALYEFVHYRVGSDRALAEDVVQDTMLVALDSLRGFDGRSSLHTWLCAIAKNKISAARRRRSPVLLEDLLNEKGAEIEAILSQVDSEPLPDWVLERSETQELVGATLSSLPPDYRGMLVDKYMEGLSVKQIAAKHDRGHKAAESTLQRARVAFQRIFQLLSRGGRGGLE